MAQFSLYAHKSGLKSDNIGPTSQTAVNFKTALKQRYVWCIQLLGKHQDVWTSQS